MLTQSVPEIFDVITKRKSPPSRKQPKKSYEKHLKKHWWKSQAASKIQKSQNPYQNKRKQRSRSEFVWKVKMLPNVLPLEASHSSLDIFKRSPALITLESILYKKLGPIESTNGPTLEFEVVGDGNNFLDLQKILLERKCKKSQNDSPDLRYGAANIAQFDTLVFINNTSHSLFSECTVSANGIKV